jgi:formylglycine-generating enzyme required for sulfatase activity
LAVVVSVQDAERWWGKLRFSLAPNAPPGASIDPQTGEFSWAPPLDQAAGKYDVTVSVQGLDDQTVQTTLVVTVIRPIAARPTLPGKEIAVDLGDGVKLEMVLIPAGEFLMGSPKSDKDAGPAEQPQHRVRIKPFYLGKYLVTQGQWHAVMGSNPSLFMGPKNPVENVNWSDCQVFLGKLNEKISGQGGNFVLPTEAQWEYACRAGSTKRYCFGDEESGLGEYAWYAANSNGKTHPVGEKKPNAWGLYDMHGNVWEWCQDWYDAGYYAKSPTGDPTGSRGGLGRVGRGGSWHGPAGFCRSAARDGDGPGDRNSNLGFRVARVPEPAAALKVEPISPRTIEAGKPMTVAVSVEDAQRWKGNVLYSLVSNAPLGASIDETTGEFSWIPPSDQAAGRYDVTVSAQSLDGQTAQMTFVVTVTRPIPTSAKLTGKEIAVDVGNGVKLELVLIPADEFLMGEPDETGHDDPRHRVRITKPFYLGKYLVTQEQWEAVMGSNPSHFKGPKNPVEQVSWGDCRKFVEELDARVGGGKFSLPTEAQWEYACRAGSTTRYCFGDDELRLDEYAWFRENSGRQTHPVGEKKPNAWGLYDMHGNVYEWCQDWYDGYYAGSPTNDPTGPSEGSCHVFRGGSWDNGAGGCGSACREGFIDESQPRLLAILGFRVARVPAESPPSMTALRLQPIAEQTVEAGKPLTLAAPVDNADAWKGKLQYRLAGPRLPGARIDPQSGEFSWTPPSDQAAGKHDVSVSVEAPGGRKDQTTFTITVTRPPPWGERELAVEVTPGVKLEMVLIPVGEFLMGSPDSDKDASEDDKPQHRVRITKPFYLGKYLVTQEQWKAVMGNNPSVRTWPKNPVEQVSWEDCRGFVEKLNTKMGSGKFTLPTEAQWEYACRARSTSRYCFGDNESGLDEYAWYLGSG